MSFLAPLMLLGLLATLVPPILHLLNRREARPTPFPAMEFLKRAHRKTARRLKMKQWLLLALRMLLCALLALSIARPIWESKPKTEASLRSASQGLVHGAHVLLIDLSYQMGYEADGGLRLIDLAKSHALRALSDSTGPAALITVGQELNETSSGLTADRSLLMSAVRELRVTEASGNLSEGLSRAYRLLQDRPLAEEKQVTVISSPSRYRETLPPPPSGLGQVHLSYVDLRTDLNSEIESRSVEGDQAYLSNSERSALANHALTDLTLSPAPQMGEGQWSVEVKIANYSHRAMKLWPIWVELEGEVKVRGFVTLGPNEIGTKRLYFRARSSQDAEGGEEGTSRPLRGWVKLSPDALSIDDQRPFWVEPAPPAKLLALNGDPRPTPQDDELFYIERALAPKVLGREQVRLVSRPTQGGGLSEGSLEGVDLILIANVPRPDPELGEMLLSHLHAGGGIWLAPGARVDIATWNRVFAEFLPRPLRGIRRSGDAAAELTSRRAARLTQFQDAHALFSPFEAPERSSLSLAHLNTYMLFDPMPIPQTEVVASLDEGAPYMITRQVDEGRVILWAGPVDREWGDLVLRPDFVPLVGETLRYLTQENTGMLLSKPLGGELSVDLNGAGPFTAISPQGMSVVLSRSEASEGERHTRGWQLKGLTEVGHHKITAPVTSESVVLLERDSANEGEQVARRFVVHLDPRLSELRSEIEDETEEAKSASPLVGALAQRSELWHIGLIGLFILALLEGITLYQRREDRVGVITR